MSKCPDIKDMPMKAYIGDGVYAGYDGDGIWLAANDPSTPTDAIYLEPKVLESLVRFNATCEERVRAAKAVKGAPGDA